MDVVILAAGQGTRLRPLTNDIPKTLVDVRGKSILGWILDALPDQITRVIIVRHYKGEAIEAAFGQSYAGRSITYVDQPTVAGTADALTRAQSHLASDRPFLVLHGDNLYSAVDLERLVLFDCALGVYRYVRPSVKLVFDGNERGLLTGAHSPTPEELTQPVSVCAGSYMLDSHIFDIPIVPIGNGEAGLPHTVLEFAKRYPVTLFEHTYWEDVNTLADLEQVRASAELR